MYEVIYDDWRSSEIYHYYAIENAITKYNELIKPYEKEDIKRIWDWHVELLNWEQRLKIEEIKPLDIIILPTNN